MLVIESLQFFYTRGGSQVCKRCQVPDDVWDGARQIFGLKYPASKYTYTDWVWCQILCSPHQVYIAFYIWIYYHTNFHLIGSWFTKSFRWDKDTHLETKVGSEEFPHALKNENENENETMHAAVVFPHSGLLKESKNTRHTLMQTLIIAYRRAWLIIHTLYSHIGILNCKLTFLWQSG